MATRPENCGFSLDHYREIVEVLRDRYKVIRFRDVESAGTVPDRRRAILRHDVDLSIENAAEMAELEYRVGVRATYFIRLDARYYNPMYFQHDKLLRQILGWGHDIGLHYSTAQSLITGESPLAVVNRQLRILRDFLSYDVVIGAAHEPARLDLDTASILRQTELAMEAYEPRFVREMKYLSDSAGRWREGCAHEWLDRDLELCILTHPFWWYKQTPLERY